MFSLHPCRRAVLLHLLYTLITDKITASLKLCSLANDLIASLRLYNNNIVKQDSVLVLLCKFPEYLSRLLPDRGSRSSSVCALFPSFLFAKITFEDCLRRAFPKKMCIFGERSTARIIYAPQRQELIDRKCVWKGHDNHFHPNMSFVSQSYLLRYVYYSNSFSTANWPYFRTTKHVQISKSITYSCDICMSVAHKNSTPQKCWLECHRIIRVEYSPGVVLSLHGQFYQKCDCFCDWKMSFEISMLP